MKRLTARREGTLIDSMEEENSPALTTFADMMTLLLVFFILMYSMYNLETEKLKAAVAEIEITSQKDGKHVSLLDYINANLGGDPISLERVIGLSGFDNPAAATAPTPTTTPPSATPIGAAAELKSLIQSAKLGDSVVAVTQGEQVIIRVDGELLFDSGSAELRDASRPVFDTLAVTFSEFPDFHVDIRGHTDDLPIATARFASNWELSALRATSALRYFIELGLPPGQFTATGYADRLPLVDNATPAGRAANRRVEFVLEKRS